MKGHFEIKIADLLNHLGKDTLSFEHIKTPLLPKLTEEGITGKLVLHSVDGQSVLVCIEELECKLHTTCERCGKDFIRTITVDSYVAKFTLDCKEEENSDEEVLFPIDKKNDTIDVEEMLYQAVMFREPFVVSCEMCEKKEAEDNLEESSFF
jgi:uncharacterized metal-binding protein YceD (DUF177 family)